LQTSYNLYELRVWFFCLRRAGKTDTKNVDRDKARTKLVCNPASINRDSSPQSSILALHGYTAPSVLPQVKYIISDRLANNNAKMSGPGKKSAGFS